MEEGPSGPADCLRDRTGAKMGNLSIPVGSEPEACQVAVALSRGPRWQQPPGAAELWIQPLPRPQGWGPGPADSDPRAAPDISDGLGQVTPLFRKRLVSRSIYTKEAVGGLQL